VPLKPDNTPQSRARDVAVLPRKMHDRELKILEGKEGSGIGAEWDGELNKRGWKCRQNQRPKTANFGGIFQE
jgi:hypothetical protein